MPAASALVFGFVPVPHENLPCSIRRSGGLTQSGLQRFCCSGAGSVLVCVMCTVLLMVVAFFEIQRVEYGNLFVTALPWEDTPSTVETLDAAATARMYLVPALLFLGMIGMVVSFLAPRAIRQRAKLPTAWRPLVILFLLAVTADLATTLWFFHSRGIDHELHPGVRLFGYAYGRTVG